MAIFEDKDLKKKVQILEDEKKKLWERITKLEAQNDQIRNEIIAKTSESQSEAFQSSRKVTEYKNRSEKRYNEATTYVSNIEKKLKDAENFFDQIVRKKDEITILKTQIEQVDEDSKTYFKELNERIDKIDSFTEKYPDLDEKISEIERFINDVEVNLNKSRVSLSTLNSRKKEIEDYYRELFGYEEEDENGSYQIPGRKEQLDDIYVDLLDGLERSTERLKIVDKDYEEKFKTFEEQHSGKYQQILEEIEALLPNAMTAGLSSAFSSKKQEEVTQSDELKKSFNFGISLMIVFSLLPLIFSFSYIYRGHSFEDTILELPRIVLAIIPIYIPVLWFTYSANKKLNLSKRLIEEYSHKEVLSKTYEGLSKQINNLDNRDESKELKYRLLSAFLQVSSENPGKLISNYEASDHPLMEALEQSYKFQVAIDKLEGVPGLGKIAAMLESNSKKKLIEKEEKVKQALSNSLKEEVEDTHV